ncbi:hypothetical protein CXF85_16295 [Colwellia sp. 75C3]|nr:hypothetical protein CXF85_16295 [Colwellia sp. 75C3]
MIIFKWPKYPITSLLSIPIASYCSIKRLALELLFSLNSVTLINPNGIINQSLYFAQLIHRYPVALIIPPA